MGGHRFKIDYTYRKRGSADRPPTWYDHYYKGPESDWKPVLIGKSERLRRHLNHKFYPADGTWPRVMAPWTDGVAWLVECWRSARARGDATAAAEDEEVREA